MVKLTSSLVSQKASQNRLGHKIDKDSILRSVTHIKLHDNFIHEIGDISTCQNLTVLYLHNNCIERIENLQHARNLTHLYLQKNKIAKMENLAGLQKLRKLYLGQNCIAVLEGLERLRNIEELHVEKQELPPGESLYFDPRTISSLSECLKFLNTSGNKVTSLSDLAGLRMLQSLVARDNCLEDISDVTDTLMQWPLISSIDLQGNPVTKHKKYKENITVSSPPSLICIDGKEVTETTRTFLKRLQWNKANRPATKNISGLSETTVSNNLAGLAKQLPVGVRNTLSQAVLTSSGVMGDFPASTSTLLSSKKRSTCQTNGEQVSRMPRPFLRHTRIARDDGTKDQQLSTEKTDLLRL